MVMISSRKCVGGRQIQLGAMLYEFSFHVFMFSLKTVVLLVYLQCMLLVVGVYPLCIAVSVQFCGSMICKTCTGSTLPDAQYLYRVFVCVYVMPTS